ncbi:MAG TPA: hypothetical protein VFJ43_03840 [Bacteroidia bacterium]|nr:hypothetical protein [Bacteroidia bacterium]
MSNNPNDPFDPEAWKKQTPPNYNQQVPPNYNQQVPPNYNQQVPPNYNQQIPPNYNQQVPPNYNQQVPPNYNQQYPPNYNQQFPPGGYQQTPPGGFQPFGANFAGQIDLPGGSNAQVCGIIGIVLFWNIIGIILNIVAIVTGGNALREYERYPGRYTEDSMRKARVGRTCGTIGLSLFGLFILIAVFVIAANA